MKHLFISDSFTSSRWQSLANAEVATTVTQLGSQAEALAQLGDPAATLVWVMADHPQVMSICQTLADRNQRVVVLYTQPDAELMKQLISNGARGYASAAASRQVLLQISKVVMQGGLWLPDSFLANLVGLTQKTLSNHGRRRSDKQAAKIEQELSCLTPREREVCDCVLEGLTNAEVADRLYVSERTVKEHMSQVFRKLNIKDRLQLVLKMNPRQVNS